MNESSMSSQILKVQNLYKFFGELAAVNDVSFQINEGEIVGLIGPNGSGKTTLFNTISGVYKPDKGEIYFRDRRIDGLKPYQIYRLGLTRSFQIPRIFNKVTVAENFMIAPRNQKGEKPIFAPIHRIWDSQEKTLAEATGRLLARLNLDSVYRSWATEVSGGQMKLTEIGRTLASGNVSLVLLDEPTAGVAPLLAHEIFKFIQKTRSQYGISFFIIEHRLDLLFKYVDRVMVMHQGKIIADGTPREVTANPEVIDAYLGEV